MSTNPPPRRRFTLEIRIGADDWNGVLSTLDEIAQDAPRDRVHGGPSRGYSVRCVEDPEMTHEKYHEALERYLDAQKQTTPKDDRDHECG